MGGFQDCVKVLILAITEVPGGVAALIRRSVTIAQAGREGVRSRYDFSHMISIASFRALMFRMLRPPSSIGLYRYSSAILGAVSCSHMKSLIILSSAVSMWAGIPWAVARNWVCPPMIAWIMSLLP